MCGARAARASRHARTSFLWDACAPPAPCGAMRHTRGCRAGSPAAYFALHRIGFFVPLASRRGAVGSCPTFSPSPRVRAFPAFRRRGATRGCLFSVTLSVNAGYGPRCPGLGGSDSGRHFARLAARARHAGATTFLAGNPALRCPDFPLEVAKNLERRSGPKANTPSKPIRPRMTMFLCRASPITPKKIFAPRAPLAM